MKQALCALVLTVVVLVMGCQEPVKVGDSFVYCNADIIRVKNLSSVSSCSYDGCRVFKFDDVCFVERDDRLTVVGRSSDDLIALKVSRNSKNTERGSWICPDEVLTIESEFYLKEWMCSKRERQEKDLIRQEKDLIRKVTGK